MEPDTEVRTVSRRGGKRPGAGRKPKGPKAGVPHVRRESFSYGTPIHVTVRVCKGIPSLRSRKARRVVFQCLDAAKERFGVRFTQFSIQANHIHLIVEARSRWALTRAIKGFSVRIARRLNRVCSRRGQVFADRYHAHPLRTPSEVRNAVRYVMENSRIHALRRGEYLRHTVDPFAGGPCAQRFLEACRKLVVEPRSFLLRRAWEIAWVRRAVAAPPEPGAPRAGPADGFRHRWIVREAAGVRYAA